MGFEVPGKMMDRGRMLLFALWAIIAGVVFTKIAAIVFSVMPAHKLEISMINIIFAVFAISGVLSFLSAVNFYLEYRKM